MNRVYKRCSLVLGLFFLSFHALATWPVIDLNSIAKQVKEIEVLNAQLKQISGMVSMDQWKSTLSTLGERNWQSTDWSSALNGQGAGAFQRGLGDYQNLHPGLSSQTVEAYSKGASEGLSQVFHEEVKNNQTAQAMASASYEDLAKEFQALEALGRKIGSSDFDGTLKDAVDLNSRIQLESGNLLAQSLRMLVLMNQQMVQSSASRLEQSQLASAYLAKE